MSEEPFLIVPSPFLWYNQKRRFYGHTVATLQRRVFKPRGRAQREAAIRKTDRRPQNRRPRRPHSQPAVSNAPELLLRVSRSGRLPFGDFAGTGADGAAGRKAGHGRPPENAL